MSNQSLHSNPELIKSSHFEDLLFAKKNKAYGAYELRQLQHRNAIVGLLISAFLVTFGFSWSFIKDVFETKEETPIKIREKRVLNYSELSAPPPIELEKPPPEKMNVESRKVKKFVKPVVKPDEEVIDEELIPTIEELETADVGLEDVEGLDSLILDQDIASFDELEIEEKPEEPYIHVEQMPSFPGGEVELFRYLGQNVKYPRLARESKITGLVIVRFVVDKEGNITNIQVMRGIGGGCDEEAVRVVEGIPKWEPGVQNGRAVPVVFNLPIRFTLRDN